MTWGPQWQSVTVTHWSHNLQHIVLFSNAYCTCRNFWVGRTKCSWFIHAVTCKFTCKNKSHLQYAWEKSWFAVWSCYLTKSCFISWGTKSHFTIHMKTRPLTVTKKYHFIKCLLEVTWFFSPCNRRQRCVVKDEKCHGHNCKKTTRWKKEGKLPCSENFFQVAVI